MKFFLTLLIIIIIPSSLLADDKEDIRLAMEFSRMKYRSDYISDLKKANKIGQLFILWVDVDDPKLYAKLKAEHPDAIHSFSESTKLQGVTSGIIIGVRGQTEVEQVRAISSSNLGELKTKGVILPNPIIQDSPRLYPRYSSYPSGCPGGFTSGFR
jgi:hypothetical protein